MPLIKFITKSDLFFYCDQILPPCVLLSLPVDRSDSEVDNIVYELITQVSRMPLIGVGGESAQTHVPIFFDKKSVSGLKISGWPGVSPGLTTFR